MSGYEPHLEILLAQRWAEEDGKENFKINLKAEISEREYINQIAKFYDARLKKISELKKKEIRFKDLSRAVQTAQKRILDDIQLRFFLELKNALYCNLFDTKFCYSRAEQTFKDGEVAVRIQDDDKFDCLLTLQMVLPRTELDKRGHQRWIYPPNLIFFYSISEVGTRESTDVIKDSFNLSKIIPHHLSECFSGGEHFDIVNLRKQKFHDGIKCLIDLRGIVLAEEYFSEDFLCSRTFETAELNNVLFRQKRDGLFSALYEDSELVYRPIIDEPERVEVMIGHKDKKINGKILLTKLDGQLPLFLSFGYEIDVSGDETKITEFLKDYWPSSE